MYKIAKKSDDLENNWIASLFDKEVEVYHEIDNSEAYEFDLWALVRCERKWYIVGTHGCSCPSYEEMAQIELGPFTKKEMIKQIKAGNYKGYTMRDGDENDIIKILEETK